MKSRPKLTDPIVICGLPGSALVGKVAVDHLIETLPSTLLAEVYCEGFAPQVFIDEEGRASILKNEIHFWKGERGLKRDVILYTGDAQPSTPESEYSLSETVIDYLGKEQGGKELITLGAYATGEFSRDPKVYAAITDASLAPKILGAGCVLMQGGAITGMNGLLLGMAKIKGMSGYALLGETSGYAIDPRASEALLTALFKLTGLKVELKELEERAKEAQAILGAVEAQSRRERGQEPGGSEEKPGYIT